MHINQIIRQSNTGRVKNGRWQITLCRAPPVVLCIFIRLNIEKIMHARCIASIHKSELFYISAMIVFRSNGYTICCVYSNISVPRVLA